EGIAAPLSGATVIRESVDKDTTQDREEALLDLYRKLRPGELTTIESARSLVNTLFYNPKRYDLTRVGRYKLNQQFGRESGDLENIDHYRAKSLGLLSQQDILDTIK